jgi:hypothetical protein
MKNGISFKAIHVSGTVREYWDSLDDYFWFSASINNPVSSLRVLQKRVLK